MSRRELSRRIALIVLGTLAGLAVAEVVLRIVLPRAYPEVGLLRSVSGDPIRFEYIPGAKVGNVQINSSGFREDEFPPTEDTSEVRILWLGDSVTMGWGVSREQRFSDLCALRLGSQLHRRLRSLNLGVEGYSNFQELLVFEKFGGALKPQVVLIGFCWNDVLRYEHFVDSSGHNKFLLENRVGNQEPQPSLIERISMFVRRHSMLVYFVQERIRNNSTGNSKGETLGVPLSFGAFLEWYLNAWEGRSFELLKGQLLRMKQLADSLKSSFGLVLLPLSIQIEEESTWDHFVPRIEGSQEKLKQFCSEVGIKVLDVTVELRRQFAADHRRLFLDVWHLNPRGHQVVAKFLVSELPHAKALGGSSF